MGWNTFPGTNLVNYWEETNKMNPTDSYFFAKSIVGFVCAVLILGSLLWKHFFKK